MSRAAALPRRAPVLALLAGIGGAMLAPAAPAPAQTSSTQQSPSVAFDTYGDHAVTLTACNADGCHEVTQTVTVLDPRPAVVSATVGAATVEAGQLLQVAGAGTGQPPLTYTWRVLEGTTPVQEFTGANAWWDTDGRAPGNYSLVLRITNAAGTADSAPLQVAVAAPSPGDFYTVPPCRVLDTRASQLGPLSSGVPRVLGFGTACEIPAAARAVAANVTAITPTGQGNMAFYPGNYPVPATSTINFPVGATLANNAILPLASDGTASLAMVARLADLGTVHVIVDVSGYFLPE